MPDSRTSQGVAVCRALMRELDDRPLRLDIFTGAGRWPYEWTTGCRLADQWTVQMAPAPDGVSAACHGRSTGAFGMDAWDLLDPPHVPGIRTTGSAYVGDAYTARLRQAVERALAVCDIDYTAARKGTS